LFGNSKVVGENRRRVKFPEAEAVELRRRWQHLHRRAKNTSASETGFSSHSFSL